MRERGNKFVDPDKAFIIHKDQANWLWRYRGKETPIQPLFDERQKKCEEGTPFWETDHDEELAETARERGHIIRGLLNIFGKH